MKLCPSHPQQGCVPRAGVRLKPDVSLNSLPVKHRRDYWSAFMSDFWRVSRPLVGDHELFLDVVSRKVDTAVFSQMVSSGAEFVDNTNSLDCILVRYQNAGQVSTRANGEETVCRPGSISVTDLSASRSSFGGASDVTYLAFPRSVLQTGNRPIKAKTFFDDRTSVGRLMIANFLHVAEEISGNPEERNVSTLELFSSLLAVSVTDIRALTGTDKATDHAKRIRAERYIFSRPLSVGLKVDDLCKDVGMSRATVYRLFQDDGGIQAFVSNLRIARAYASLARQKPARGLVALVALQCGFSNASNFNRRFRQRFGCTPGDVLGSALVGNGGAEQVVLPDHGKQSFSSVKSNRHHRFFQDLGSLTRRHQTPCANAS